MARTTSAGWGNDIPFNRTAGSTYRHNVTPVNVNDSRRGFFQTHSLVAAVILMVVLVVLTAIIANSFVERSEHVLPADAVNGNLTTQSTPTESSASETVAESTNSNQQAGGGSESESAMSAEGIVRNDGTAEQLQNESQATTTTDTETKSVGTEQETTRDIVDEPSQDKQEAVSSRNDVPSSSIDEQIPPTTVRGQSLWVAVPPRPIQVVRIDPWRGTRGQVVRPNRIPNPSIFVRRPSMFPSNQSYRMNDRPRAFQGRQR